MKIYCPVVIDCESWFDEDKEPKTKQEWHDFLSLYLFSESSVWWDYEWEQLSVDATPFIVNKITK